MVEKVVDDIKAVYIEVIDGGLTSNQVRVNDIVRAPFAGIYMREVPKQKVIDSYVVLETETDKSDKTKEKSLDIFNIMYYNIVTVETVKKDHSEFCFFRNGVKEQEKAFELIAGLLAHMQEVKRVTGDESIIDIATYETNAAILSKVAGEHVTHTTYGAQKPKTGSNVVYSTYRAPAKTTTTTGVRSVEPAVIKRKRAASKALLRKMLVAVQEISENKYKAPEFPPLPEIKDGKEDAKDDDEDDDATIWYRGV